MLNPSTRLNTNSSASRMAWFVAALLSMGLAAWLGLHFAPMLAHALSDTSSKNFWFVSRATGVIAYLLFWAAIMLGLLMSNKMAKTWPSAPVAYALHEYLCLLGLAFAAFHALILVGDGYIQASLAQILVPFAMPSAVNVVWAGLGQLGFYLLLGLVLSFYVRRFIGTALWRALHFATFVAYMLISVHGLLIGSDSKTPLMLGVYLSTNASVFFLMFYRIIGLRVN